MKRCVFCGEIGFHKQVYVCRDHLNMIHGLPPVENHHPEGRANSPETIRVPTSIHFILSLKQNQWDERLRYPSSNPAIQIARRDQLALDFMDYYVKAARRDPGFLLALALDQEERNGEGWWGPDRIASLNPVDSSEDSVDEK